MLETGVDARSEGGDFAPFLEAGTAAAGLYLCADCGYGVSVRTLLPICPMCAGRIWEPDPRYSPKVI